MRRIPARLAAPVALLLVASVALSLACATPRLAPAPGAELDPGPGVGAATTEAGARVEVRARAWRWTPESLEQHVLPLLVTIENESERALRVRYSELRVAGPDEATLAAIPPFDMEAEVLEPIDDFAYPHAGFAVAPHLGTHGAFGPYLGPFAYDVGYYHHYYPRFREVDLPTQEMLTRALPEGVLEPGGRITGFVYFEPLEKLPEGADRVLFRFELVDADTRDRFGTAAIPFALE